MIDWTKIPRKYASPVHKQLHEIYDFQFFVRQTHLAENFQLELADWGDSLSLDFLGVSMESRKQGIASEVLAKICALSDECNYDHIKLSVSTQFGMDRSYLIDFYARFGFLQTDFNSVNMVRLHSSLWGRPMVINSQWLKVVAEHILYCIPLARADDLTYRDEGDLEAIEQWARNHDYYETLFSDVLETISPSSTVTTLDAEALFKLLSILQTTFSHYEIYAELQTPLPIIAEVQDAVESVSTTAMKLKEYYFDNMKDRIKN